MKAIVIDGLNRPPPRDPGPEPTMDWLPVEKLVIDTEYLLARLEDGIFEGLSAEDAKAWPLRFANAVPVGADLSLVWPRFTHWMLVDKEYGVVRFANENGRLAIEAVAALYARQIAGDMPTKEEFRQARKAAAADAADAAWRRGEQRAREETRRAQADKLIELLAAA